MITAPCQSHLEMISSESYSTYTALYTTLDWCFELIKMPTHLQFLLFSPNYQYIYNKSVLKSVIKPCKLLWPNKCSYVMTKYNERSPLNYIASKAVAVEDWESWESTPFVVIVDDSPESRQPIPAITWLVDTRGKYCQLLILISYYDEVHRFRDGPPWRLHSDQYSPIFYLTCPLGNLIPNPKKR